MWRYSTIFQHSFFEIVVDLGNRNKQYVTILVKMLKWEGEMNRSGDEQVEVDNYHFLQLFWPQVHHKKYSYTEGDL